MNNKFLKIKTFLTQEEINSILEKCTESQINDLETLYTKFDFVEYTNSKNGFNEMYVSISDLLLEEFTNFCLLLNISFDIKDLTDNIILGNFPQIEDFHSNLRLKLIISFFLKNNLTLDNVLDKINQYGINSLNGFDKELLENI